MLNQYRIRYKFKMVGISKPWFKKKEVTEICVRHTDLIAHDKNEAKEKFREYWRLRKEEIFTQIKTSISERGRYEDWYFVGRGMMWYDISDIYLTTDNLQIDCTVNYSTATIETCMKDLTPAQFKECFGYMCPLGNK